MNWLKNYSFPNLQKNNIFVKKSIPKGLWIKCLSCKTILYKNDLKFNQQVCPKCDHHMYIRARNRLNDFLDKNNFHEIGKNILPIDILKFKDNIKYVDRLKLATKISNETDALIVIKGSIMNLPLVVAVFEFEFMGGSMGSVVGERFIQGVQISLEQKIPFICITATGGARMQEGLLSLMQMAKTTAILTKLSKKKIPFISILTNPTMGGVSASFAFMGDIVIAEPGALIGFAGPRVIENTVKEKLPDGFQHSEFLLKKGALDMIIDRRKLRFKIARLLALLQNKSI
ncbi:acetyl-CoA carboxylase carboxyltransferase subunit beta [Candidatus Profftella armatura (Diaphorina cf. continua)]|uniref:Acetyl-coenzyme A carboxylase carboxyl transferase subunit beta n=1 Tax=Candidatus Profftella armatura (Diaphorina cf. continua) TaxID=2661583 RepID=A0A7R6VYM1_9PROT|nr:acetyl-CoA carboxylase, carboxyltransferase subunit beta [Candidatus Profftella armatura (Diaphorina cf. continua)]BCG49522.1 acetyl-CoA carboxylase carboxyltransferase subunit beta [Candidatus Profftella armatura (Diaphorina cf. continua)]